MTKACEIKNELVLLTYDHRGERAYPVPPPLSALATIITSGTT